MHSDSDSGTLATSSFSVALLHQQEEATEGLLPELNGADLAMSLSPNPKHHQPHTTPFSVTDILSPIEESYRKLDLCAPSSPYRSSTGSSVGGTISPNPMGTPGPSPYMHMHQFPAQYCNGGDPISSYGNTTAAGWYPSTANDPRFASKYSLPVLFVFIKL